MAFGFDKPTRGLIAEPAAGPGRRRRYLLDFARAYAGEVIMLSAHDPGIRTEGDLLFSLDVADRGRAAALGAHFVPCFPDPALSADGSQETEDFALAREDRTPATVCLFGPESTGKSTLAAALARHYGTLHVTEYVRGYLDAIRSSGTAADVPWIARGQRAAEIATAQQVRDLLVCDTNLATIMLWSDVLFGDSPQWLRAEALRQKFDLWLLTDIDVPFEPDPQRCFPDDADREWLMRQCVGLLERLGVTPVCLRGNRDERLQLAIGAIDRLRHTEHARR